MGFASFLVFGLVAVVLGSAPAYGQELPPNSEPSDPRATFVPENVRNCADAGYPDDVQIYGEDRQASGDPYVQASVTGSDPTKVQVEITDEGESAGVVIDTVVVKGGTGSNLYKSPYVPPELEAPQDYISPTNEGGNVADVSHYLVCYHIDDQPQPEDPGSLLVLKRVVAPEGGSAEPLPTEYTVNVTCTPPSGAPIEDTITFGAGGGIGTTSDGTRLVKDIPEGSTCTVVEEGTDGLPDGAEVRYTPSRASKSGITTGTVRGSTVVITNDFSDVTPATGDFRITKEVAPPGYSGPPDAFTVRYACQGPKTGTVQLSPGETATVRDIRDDAYCIVREPARQLPAGWEVSYSVDGKPSSRAPIFKVSDTKDVSVTVTNTAGDIPPDKDA